MGILISFLLVYALQFFCGVNSSPFGYHIYLAKSSEYKSTVSANFLTIYLKSSNAESPTFEMPTPFMTNMDPNWVLFTIVSDVQLQLPLQAVITNSVQTNNPILLSYMKITTPDNKVLYGSGFYNLKLLDKQTIELIEGGATLHIIKTPIEDASGEEKYRIKFWEQSAETEFCKGVELTSLFSTPNNVVMHCHYNSMTNGLQSINEISFELPQNASDNIGIIAAYIFDQKSKNHFRAYNLAYEYVTNKRIILITEKMETNFEVIISKSELYLKEKDSTINKTLTIQLIGQTTSVSPIRIPTYCLTNVDTCTFKLDVPNIGHIVNISITNTQANAFDEIYLKSIFLIDNHNNKTYYAEYMTRFLESALIPAVELYTIYKVEVFTHLPFITGGTLGIELVGSIRSSGIKKLPAVENGFSVMHMFTYDLLKLELIYITNMETDSFAFRIEHVHITDILSGRSYVGKINFVDGDLYYEQRLNLNELEYGLNIYIGGDKGSGKDIKLVISSSSGNTEPIILDPVFSLKFGRYTYIPDKPLNRLFSAYFETVQDKFSIRQIKIVDFSNGYTYFAINERKEKYTNKLLLPLERLQSGTEFQFIMDNNDLSTEVVNDMRMNLFDISYRSYESMKIPPYSLHNPYSSLILPDVKTNIFSVGLFLKSGSLALNYIIIKNYETEDISYGVCNYHFPHDTNELHAEVTIRRANFRFQRTFLDTKQKMLAVYISGLILIVIVSLTGYICAFCV